MDAESLLRKQGWRGAGHSLDASGRGIKKPLLIAHKQDVNGLGHKKAAWKTDDQWWMRAFDESLQTLGTGKATTLSEIQDKGISRGGLYGFFVRGEGLTGTIGGEETEKGGEGSEASEKPGKRKRTKEEDGAARKKARQAGTATEVDTVLGTIHAREWARICSVRKSINRRVKAETKASEKAGMYGACPASGAKQPRIGQKHDQGAETVGETMTRKTAKAHRKKAMRAAREDLARELVVEACLAGKLPNAQEWSREKLLRKYTSVEKALKMVDKAHRAAAKEVGNGQKDNADTEAKQKSIVDAQLAALTPAKRADYEARAAEKSQSLEEYILRRVEKNRAKKASKKAAIQSSSNKANGNSVTTVGETSSGGDMRTKRKHEGHETGRQDGVTSLDSTQKRQRKSAQHSSESRAFNETDKDGSTASPITAKRAPEVKPKKQAVSITAQRREVVTRGVGTAITASA